jgi:predicted nuclease with TOPRIM domain
MFDSLEQKIYNNGVQNETSKPNDYWEQKYRALEDNYNKLQTRVELLQTKYNVQQLELISMKNETMECKRCNYLQLESNYTRLQNRMESVEYEYTSWKGELISLRNRSLEHDKDIVDLKMLKNIQPIQDFHNLQKQVELINAMS